MRKTIAIIAITLILTSHANKEQKHETEEKHENLIGNRGKRSVNDEEEKPFWANRGKRSVLNKAKEPDDSDPAMLKYAPDDVYSGILDKNERPFWGNRGRRDSKEVVEDIPLPMSLRSFIDNTIFDKLLEAKSVCIDANVFLKNKMLFPDHSFTFKERREDETNPFWGNRGRRTDEESEESPFWGNRGRREDDGPFWGARGRRDEDTPFWGSRGRREEESQFREAHSRDNEVTLENKQAAKENLLDLLKSIKFELSSRFKRKTPEKSFWKNRERNAGLQLFKDGNRLTASRVSNVGNDFIRMKSLRQDHLYADHPYYVLVDRNSRSLSSEDDPYFISRGKKKVTPVDLAKAARDRRGIFEQFAKHAQEDPYFVSRGKKEDSNVKHDQLVKAKDLICSAVNLINSKERNRRDLSDRDRRNILRKLAAQLTSDPYFVSRGKKSLDLNVENGLKQMYQLCS